MAASQNPTDDGRETEALILRPPPGAKFFSPAAWSALFTMPSRPDELSKIPLPCEPSEEGHAIENRVYTRLGTQPNLDTVTKMNEYGIYLQRAAHGCLRTYYMQGGAATPAEKLKWSLDVANVLEYVHQHGVRHGDMGGKNLLLDSERERNNLLCDFSGSCIDGKKALMVAEKGFRHPGLAEYQLPTIRGEIHALGSTIYEIVTEKTPHQGLEEQGFK